MEKRKLVLEKLGSMLLAVTEVYNEYLGLLLVGEFTGILLICCVRSSNIRWKMMKRL